MKLAIKSRRIFHGPSVYAPHPVVVASLRGMSSSSDRDAAERMLAVLKALFPRSCEGAESCPATPAVRQAGPVAALCHALEHVCIDLQRIDPGGLQCARTSAHGRPRSRRVAIPYEDPDTCIEALDLVLELVARVLAEAAGGGGEEGGGDASARIRELRKAARRRSTPLQDRAVCEAAAARDIPVRKLAQRVMVLGQGRFQQRVSGTKTSLTNVVSNDIASNKDYARRLLGAIGLPVPRFERVYTEREAVEAAERVGYPVVLKPNNSGMGDGVSVGMRTREQVQDAYRLAREHDRSVLVEEFVRGGDYRLLVIDGKFQAAARREPPCIVADGVRTIKRIVAEVNSDPRRNSGRFARFKRIDLDDHVDHVLEAQGYDLDSVPKAGVVVYLRRNANLSTGGTARDVTDRVHPDNREIAERAARAIGLDVAGVDVLTTDIGESMWTSGGRICEINSRPGVHMHLWPDEGVARDVLSPILAMLFPPGHPARIPVIGVTGIGDTSGAARMLAHVLAAAGRRVGLATREGVYSCGRRSAVDRPTPPAAARAVLLDPDVDAAVLELTPRDVVLHGLDREPMTAIVVVGGCGEEREGGPVGDVDVREAAAGIAVAVRATRGQVYVRDDDALPPAVAGALSQAELRRVRIPAAGPAGRSAAEATLTAFEGWSDRQIAELQRALSGRQAESAGDLWGLVPLVHAVARGLGLAPEDIHRALSRYGDRTPVPVPVPVEA